MKKIISFLIFISAFVAFTNAQTTGSWHYSDNNKNNPNGSSHFKPKATSIPKTVDIGLSSSPEFWTINDTLHKVMTGIVDEFKNTYPKPDRHSLFINLDGIQSFQTNNTQPKSFYDKQKSANIFIGEYGFQYDENKKVKPINVGQQVGNITEGIAHIYINYFNELRGIDILKYIDNLSWIEGSGKKEKLAETVFLAVPPAISTVADRGYKKAIPDFSIKNFPANQHLFQLIDASYAEESDPAKCSYSVQNVALLSFDGKLPFVTVSRAEF